MLFQNGTMKVIKYFSINPPDKILSRYYCFDQRDLNETNQSKVKIVAIDKNHLKYRSKFYLLALLTKKLSKLKFSLNNELNLGSI